MVFYGVFGEEMINTEKEVSNKQLPIMELTHRTLSSLPRFLKFSDVNLQFC